MIWTEAIIREAEDLYQGRTAAEVSEVLTARYHMPVSACTVRAVFSRFGIHDPKRIPQDHAKAKRLLRKWYAWGWGIYDMTEQLLTFSWWVRTELRKMRHEWVQGTLWPIESLPIAKPRMDVVHRAKEVKPPYVDGVQLSLFDELQISKAA